MRKEIRCKTGGQAAVGVEEFVDVSVGRYGTKDVPDGVALRFSSRPGDVVIDWLDFERAYLANKAARDGDA